MKPRPFSDMECSIARTLDHVGSWWSLLIIRDAMMGARRFKHFERSLGISKNTLTARLAQLIETGILAKVAAPNGSAFDEYALTERGRELAPVMIALAQWGDRWVPHEQGSSTEIVDLRTGQPLQPVWPRGEDGATMSLDELGMRRAARRPPLAWDDDEGPDGRDDEA